MFLSTLPFVWKFYLPHESTIWFHLFLYWKKCHYTPGYVTERLHNSHMLASYSFIEIQGFKCLELIVVLIPVSQVTPNIHLLTCYSHISRNLLRNITNTLTKPTLRPCSPSITLKVYPSGCSNIGGKVFASTTFTVANASSNWGTSEILVEAAI